MPLPLPEDSSERLSSNEGHTTSHGHVLSDKSIVLQRDTFFFVPVAGRPIRLILGVNQKLTPLTSARLQRWVRLMTGSQQTWFWCPVQIRPFAILSYALSPSGPVISPDSDEPLPPGNYGWFTNRELTETDYLDVRRASLSFDYIAQDVPELDEGEKLPDDISLEVLNLASARDKGRCRITGDTVDVVLTSIVPSFCWWLVEQAGDPPLSELRRPGDQPATVYDCPANVLTLRTDLQHHFHNHNFAIDADDDYRVVILREMGEAQKLLPTHLAPHPIPGVDAENTIFLRLHLRYSLCFMLCGGNVSETYPSHRILQEMEELGVRGPCIDPDHEMLGLDDKRWQTVLGQAILESVLRTKTDLYDSGREEFTSETDSSGSASRGE